MEDNNGRRVICFTNGDLDSDSEVIHRKIWNFADFQILLICGTEVGGSFARRLTEEAFFVSDGGGLRGMVSAICFLAWKAASG